MHLIKQVFVHYDQHPFNLEVLYILNLESTLPFIYTKNDLLLRRICGKMALRYARREPVVGNMLQPPRGAHV